MPAEGASSAAHEHAVSFYDEDSELTDLVGRFVADGLVADERVVVIATAAHRESVDDFLSDQGIDPKRVRADGSYRAVDAAKTLDAFLVDGQPDAALFGTHLSRVLDLAGAGGGSVRAFGEMVALLWERGDVAEAIALESLWDDLAKQQPFSLQCACPTFALDPADLSHLGRVCALHTAVLPPRSYAAPVVDPRAGERRSEVFVPAPGAVTAARRFVSVVLEAWGQDRLVWEAGVVTSELASNAVRHGNSPFRAYVDRSHGAIRIGVEDLDPDLPQRRTATIEDDNGRGIAIVDELANRWGVERLGAGKITWAELDTTPADSGR